MSGFSVLPVAGIPMIEPGDDLASIIADAFEREGLTLEAGDIICIAQKIVSKAEGRLVALSDVELIVLAHGLFEQFNGWNEGAYRSRGRLRVAIHPYDIQLRLRPELERCIEHLQDEPGPNDLTHTAGQFET